MYEELNKKLARWADVCYATPQGYYFAELPLPDFTQSLDACFKWLVPKLFELGYWLKTSHSHSMYEENVSHSVTIGQHKFTGQGEFTKAETPALALCLAIEKLIDGGG